MSRAASLFSAALFVFAVGLLAAGAGAQVPTTAPPTTTAPPPEPTTTIAPPPTTSTTQAPTTTEPPPSTTEQPPPTARPGTTRQSTTTTGAPATSITTMRPSGPDLQVPENQLPTSPPAPGDSVTPASGKLPALFPILGVAGWLVLAGLLAIQWYLTSPGRRGPTL